MPCVCLVATSFYRCVHRMLKAGVVELPGPLPGPPSIRAADKAGHHILHARKALHHTMLKVGPLTANVDVHIRCEQARTNISILLLP